MADDIEICTNCRMMRRKDKPEARPCFLPYPLGHKWAPMGDAIPPPQHIVLLFRLWRCATQHPYDAELDAAIVAELQPWVQQLKELKP